MPPIPIARKGVIGIFPAKGNHFLVAFHAHSELRYDFLNIEWGHRTEE